ncbi:unnamed protein product, partial [Urochloa humidicola]
SSRTLSLAAARSYPHLPLAARELGCWRSLTASMADLSTFADGEVAEEANRHAPGPGSSEGRHDTNLQDTKEQDVRKGKAALESTELMREELVQSAVSFLKHPKVVASSDGQRR